MDTNDIQWVSLTQSPGMSIKPLRTNRESGTFSAVIMVEGGAEFKSLVCFGAADFMVLNSRIGHRAGPFQFDEGPATPIVEVLSWMQYEELSIAAGVFLVHNTVEGGSSLMSRAPLRVAASW